MRHLLSNETPESKDFGHQHVNVWSEFIVSRNRVLGKECNGQRHFEHLRTVAESKFNLQMQAKSLKNPL
jgi:hypothetical protein